MIEIIYDSSKENESNIHEENESEKKIENIGLKLPKNVTSIGKTYVTITGTGKYYGTIKKYFNCDLSDSDVANMSLGLSKDGSNMIDA